MNSTLENGVGILELQQTQRDFFRQIFREETGVIRLATRTSRMEFRNALFAYPTQLDLVIDFVQQSINTQMEVYYSPDLFYEEAIRDQKATKDYVRGSFVIPVDFDGNAPQDESGYVGRGLPAPSIVVQSSDEYHKHVYWILDEFVAGKEGVEKLEAQRRIFTSKTDGDNSGWDAGGLFRVPGTTNWGYGKQGREAVDVFIEESNGQVISFSGLPEPSKHEFRQVVLDALSRELLNGDPPSVETILATHSMSEDFQRVYFMDASETTDRSRSLVRLAHSCVESGLTDLETYVLIVHTDKRWQKYTRRSDNDRLKLYSNCIERARATESVTEIKYIGADAAETEVAPQTVYTIAEVAHYKIHIEWYFKGLLSTTGYGLLTGPPGVGKTQMMIRMGEAICMGQSLYCWHNEQERRGKVLIFSMEMDIAQIQYFILQMGMPIEEMEDRYHIYHDQDMMPLDDKFGQRAFEYELNKVRPAVVFIDSLSKMIKKSPNDDEAVRAVQAFLSRMRKKYGCAMVMLHHTKKRDAARKTLFDLTDVHGSVFITSEADMVLIMEPIDPYIIFNLAKVRLSRLVDPIVLTRSDTLAFEDHNQLEVAYDKGVIIRDIATVALSNAIGSSTPSIDESGHGF